MGIDPKLDRSVEFADITFFFGVYRSSGSGFRPRLTNPCHLSESSTFAGTAGSTHVAAGPLDAGRRQLQNCLAKTQADLDRAVSHQFLAWAAAQDHDLASAALHAAQARHHGLSGEWLTLLERWESHGWPPPRC
jgi:hypothetical protein